MAQTKSRFRQFTDEQWERIEPLLPSNQGRQGHPFRDNRKVVEGIIYRYRTGIPWRDLPRDEYGPWQTVWKRHRRYAADGTWDRVLTQVLAEGFLAGLPGLSLFTFQAPRIALIVAAVLTIAFAAGTIPAVRAARKDPITALRHE